LNGGAARGRLRNKEVIFMPVPSSRVALTFFGFDILWYGVIITAAISIALAVTCRRAEAHGLTSERVVDFALICVPAGIVGARLYYVLFNWNFFGGDIMRIINIRTGGLAIHGALIAGLLAVPVLCRKWRLRPLNALDLAAPSLALAQSVGRWGNYFNLEAHGGPTDLPWGMMIGGETVHPTFLYESVWCFLLFFLLIFIDGRRRFEGQIFLLYCMLYSLERFFVEGLRTDSLMLFGIWKQARALSAAVFFIGAVCYIYLRSKEKRRTAGETHNTI
jgi:phosphatidylglycerol:prolipoprotein diacylglycerol transferase